MIERLVFILLSVALLASLGAFFLYVPFLPNLAVTLMLGGLFAMFWLGIRVGRLPHHGRISRPASSNGDQLSLS